MLMPATYGAVERFNVHPRAGSTPAARDCTYFTLILKRLTRITGVVGGIVTTGVGVWAVHTSSAYRGAIGEDLSIKGFWMGLWLIFNGAGCAVLEGSLKANHNIRGIIHVMIGVPLVVLLHLVPAVWVGCGCIICSGLLNFILARGEQSNDVEETVANQCTAGCCCWSQPVSFPSTSAAH